MKRLMLIVATTLLIVASTSVARAAPQWYKCDVISVGMPNESTLLVKLTHISGAPAFSNKWFSNTQPNVREMYAAALTALAAGLTLSVNADTDTNDLIFLYARND